MLLHLYGDSITAGVPGVAFSKYFKVYKKFMNHGLGGDTIIGLNTRIRDIDLNESDTYVIEIGTNDILLAYLKEKYTSWKSTIEKIEKSGRKVSRNSKEFADEYVNLLFKFRSVNTLVVSIPCIGEDIESKVNEKVDSYNRIIKDLCMANGKVYIDFNNWQKEEIESYKYNDKGFISKYPTGMIVDILLTNYLSLANMISKQRRLCTTIDGVHLNSNGAAKMAEMVESELKHSA
jgi:lysophospholipase L1-like esterase